MSDYCISNMHTTPVRATVHGTYVNGGDGWYCDECSAAGVEYGLFVPKQILRKVTKQ
jgi:hypothetical protein